MSIRNLCLTLTALLSEGALHAAPGDLTVSGPYVQANLTVFLLHGKASRNTRNLLTLQEAMDRKKVAVYETSQVNELSIENQSAEEVYVQAGDIVKGGKQDRVLETDLILPAHSGRIAIGAFCVEHGRWTRRGNEGEREFNASTRVVANRSIKLAVRDEKNQQKVWAEVASAERGMAANTARIGDVAQTVAVAPASPTSMQLAMESRRVTEATHPYVRSLSKIADGADVVGFAYAINGKLNSAEVYASHDLFIRMWPKLLESTAAEAVSEGIQAHRTTESDVDVRRMLAAGDNGKRVRTDDAGRVSVTKKDGGDTLLFESREKDAPAALHRSYVMK